MLFGGGFFLALGKSPDALQAGSNVPFPAHPQRQVLGWRGGCLYLGRAGPGGEDGQTDRRMDGWMSNGRWHQAEVAPGWGELHQSSVAAQGLISSTVTSAAPPHPGVPAGGDEVEMTPSRLARSTPILMEIPSLDEPGAPSVGWKVEVEEESSEQRVGVLWCELLLPRVYFCSFWALRVDEETAVPGKPPLRASLQTHSMDLEISFAPGHFLKPTGDGTGGGKK